MSNSKKYGLILPKKGKSQKPIFQATRNVFADDSESEDESNKKHMLLRPSDNINRQAKANQEKAILEDPTVYQYDEVYDSMVSKKEENKSKRKEETKPKYIENLMKSANKRKIENERRIERQIQKEREKEGDEFADKEVFVTSAYKKKLEEMRLEEEKEKREEYLESIGDVTKQNDLGGFYRHLYEQKLGSDKPTENKDKQEVTDDVKATTSKETLNEKPHDNPDTKEKKRNYRKRQSSDAKQCLSEGELEESDEEEINRLNLDDIRTAKKIKQDEGNIDADSDFSIDESSDDDVTKDNKEQETNKENFKKPAADKNEFKQKSNIENDTNGLKQTESKVAVEATPKIDIWKKRTVGEAFEQALKRYYERKASRGG